MSGAAPAKPSTAAKAGASVKPGAPDFLARGRDWLYRQFVAPEMPLLAVEVRPAAVAAVRLASQNGRLALAAGASLELPAGAVVPSLTDLNVVDRPAFRRTLDAVLERCGARAAGKTSLVLPDAAVRLTLVPAEGLKGRRRDQEDMIRFRLHKSLPFEARQARLSWTGPVKGQILVAAAHEPVVAEYEAVLGDSGLLVGFLEPALLALLSAVPRGDGDRLVVNWESGTLALAVLRDGWPVLLRTVSGELDEDAVAREVGNTIVYHRERLNGAGIAHAHVRTVALDPARARACLREALGLEAEPVDPWRSAGGTGTEGGEAMAAAAACALRRAA